MGTQTRIQVTVLAVVVSLFSGLGCDGQSPKMDAGQSGDAWPGEARLRDRAAPDLGTHEASTTDAPRADAVVDRTADRVVADAGGSDIRLPDVAVPDVAVGDALPPDAAPREAPLRPGQKIIGLAGGFLLSADGRLLLQVPAGALAADLLLSIEPVDASALPAGAIGAGYRITPEGTIFAAPVLLTFYLQPADIAGSSPGTLRVGAAGAGVWMPLTVTMVDVEAAAVSALAERLALFAAYRQPCTGAGQECGAGGQMDACLGGLAAGPLCAVPCRGAEDCPDPLYCLQGACALRGCRADAAACARIGHGCKRLFGFDGTPAEHENRLCLPACSEVADPNCPTVPGMACVGDACSVLADCLYDSACGWGQLCYRGGLLRPAGAMGECLGCELGCRCGDPGCPCLDGTSQLPCQAACPVAGIWEGTFTGYLVSGTWRMWVETTGVGVGFHQGMGHGHPFSGPLSGAITATGQVDFVATGSGSATCPWTGTFTASSGSGTWSCGASDHGMWSGNLKGPLSPFRGSWSGVFEGPETGVWEVTVDAAGTVAGSVSGQTASGPYSVAVQGAVSASGSARLVATGSGVLSGCAWSGTFAGRTASGQWSCPGPGPEGVWRGSWQGGSYPAPRS